MVALRPKQVEVDLTHIGYAALTPAEAAAAMDAATLGDLDAD